jgi:hypothetical protein
MSRDRKNRDALALSLGNSNGPIGPTVLHFDFGYRFLLPQAFYFLIAGGNSFF